MVEQTLAIIKPGAMKRGHQEAIRQMIVDAGFQVVSEKTVQLDLDQARAFYAVHKERPFFEDLCKFMVSGPVHVLKLSKKNAVAAFRQLIGPTNPQGAPSDTIRGRYAKSIDQNAVHGSDALETAQQEIAFFF